MLVYDLSRVESWVREISFFGSTRTRGDCSKRRWGVLVCKYKDLKKWACDRVGLSLNFERSWSQIILSLRLILSKKLKDKQKLLRWRLKSLRILDQFIELSISFIKFRNIFHWKAPRYKSSPTHSQAEKGVNEKRKKLARRSHVYSASSVRRTDEVKWRKLRERKHGKQQSDECVARLDSFKKTIECQW